MNTSIREQFTLLRNRPNYSYLDSGASSLTPDSVVKVVDEYYNSYRANIHRGMYPDSEQASMVYEDVRRIAAGFFGCNTNEIFFTFGATHGLNMIAYGLEHIVQKGDVIVLSELEHHANIVPWQQAARRTGAVLRVIPVDTETYELDGNFEKYIDEKVKIVSVAQVSNVLGTIQSITRLSQCAHSVGALMIVDASQSVAHMPSNIRELQCDFLVCSGHKMYGPTGTGIVYGSQEALEKLRPSMFGGDMIDTVEFTESTWADIPYRFEAGTPNIGGIIGLGEAIKFIESIGWDAIQSHEKDMTQKLLSVISTYARIIGPSHIINRTGVVSFVIDQIHPHDIAGFLGERKVAIRAGHHCAMPLMHSCDLMQGTARATVGIYTTEEDVMHLDSALKELQTTFG